MIARGLSPPNQPRPVETHGDGRAADLVEGLGDVVRDVVVDVAHEAQGDVVVGGLHPARAGEAAARQRHLAGDALGQLQSGEQARHRSVSAELFLE